MQSDSIGQKVIADKFAFTRNEVDNVRFRVGRWITKNAWSDDVVLAMFANKHPVGGGNCPHRPTKRVNQMLALRHENPKRPKDVYIVRCGGVRTIPQTITCRIE